MKWKNRENDRDRKNQLKMETVLRILLFFALRTEARMVPPQQVIVPRIVNLEASGGVKVEDTEGVSPGAAIVGLVVQGILESLSETNAESSMLNKISTTTTSETITTTTTTTTTEPVVTSTTGITTTASTTSTTTTTTSTKTTTTTTTTSSMLLPTTTAPHESPHLIPGWATALIVIAVIALVFAILSVLFVRYR